LNKLKLKLLKDKIVQWRLNVLHLVEMHDQNPTGPGPLKEWYKTASVPVGSEHGTAVLTLAPQGKSHKETIITAMVLNWENQEIQQIFGYFPNDL
jgi:hypothetical protein